MVRHLVLNLLKFRDTIAVLHQLITIDAFSLQLSRIFATYVKTANVQCGNVSNQFLLVASPCLQRILFQ